MRQIFLSEAYQIRCLWQSVGQGTASSELLDILGIGTPERDILFALATHRSAKHLFRKRKAVWAGTPTPRVSSFPSR